MNEKQEKIVNGVFINFICNFVCTRQFARKRGERR